MLFNTIPYLLFLPIVVVLYYLLPHRFRWMLLLAASYFFYASWRLEYLGLLVFTTLFSYFGALLIEKSTDKLKRKWLLIAILTVNLGVLFLFKIVHYLGEDIALFLERFSYQNASTGFSILLPIGISFYTLQTVGYLIDIYTGVAKAERHLGFFALFVSFFPQLVIGPIERSTFLMPQLRARRTFQYQNITTGLKWLALGMFKKMVIADRLLLYVREIYGHPDAHSGWPVIMATYFGAFLIYCDFSGYADMAVGSARLLGINIHQNFNQPFLSKNVTDIFRRWHITLMTWLKDYVFTPIAFSLRSKGKTGILIALFITLTLCGLWHETNLKFLVWGNVFGLALVIERSTENWRSRAFAWMPVKLQNALGILITFHFAIFLIMLFMVEDLTAWPNMVASLFPFGNFSAAAAINFNPENFFLCLGLIVLLEIIHYIQRNKNAKQFIFGFPALRWSGYLGISLCLLWFGIFDGNEFIYFQF